MPRGVRGVQLTDTGHATDHGHPLNGTKFWTGGSGRGSQRWYFWEDAPASPVGGQKDVGGCGDCGCFFEPQVGNGPTQATAGMEPLTAGGTQEWTEYWRTMDELSGDDYILFGVVSKLCHCAVFATSGLRCSH
jgi:hypothetical protein